jgi:multidrug efflux pump
MISIASEVFWGPMAYAIIGGLFVATLLIPTVLAGPLCGMVSHQTAAQGARAGLGAGVPAAAK